jgi:hypothetical protein
VVRRLLAALLVAGLSVLALSSCAGSSNVKVEPEPVFPLPSRALGCGGATALPGGATRVPIKTSTVAGQVAELINVCVNGQGPFPFVLDSGDAESTIDSGLAHRLHLASAGQPLKFEGVGCTGVAQPVTVAHWSAGGMALDPQTLTAAHIPEMGGRGEPDGLLGSDVLSSFGAVRIDFRADTLTFGGPQGPEATGVSEVYGPKGPPPPAVLTDGEKGTTVPLEVILAPGGTSLQVRLRIGHGPARTFAVDTGSSQSVVSSALAKAQHLARSDLAQRQSTVCSVITVPLVHTGRWSIPGVSLHPQLVGETNFGPIGGGGIVGLLGSDQLIRYGWVIFDYRGGRLVLG